jgi:hypothetical protein
MATFEPLDFNQPDNKLSKLAAEFRKASITRNDYSINNQFGATSKDAISDGDVQGKGTGTYLDTSKGGGSLDVAERKNEIKINQYQAGKPYQIPGA